MARGLRVAATVRGDLKRDMAMEYLMGERAVTRAMAGVREEVRTAWKQEIRTAGLGNRLANTIRGATYPQGTESMNAASVIWSKAPHIVSSHLEGAVIRSGNGRFLAIPTGAAGRARSPAEYQRRTGIALRFVYRRGKAPILVADDARINARGAAVPVRRRRRRDGILTGAQTVVVFILVPQVRMKKRLDFYAAAERIGAALPSKIVINWRDT